MEDTMLEIIKKTMLPGMGPASMPKDKIESLEKDKEANV